MPRPDPDEMGWARAPREVPPGYMSPIETRWAMVRHLNTLTGWRRLIGKAIFLAPIVVVGMILLVGLVR